jgi:two-component system phosphate regulon sensor histidine kinase PhoR
MNLFINISPVKVGFGSEGKEGLIMLLRDITREKSLEEERNEFISVVSHELRTPITITEGNVSNAMMVAKKDDASELIQTMLSDAHKQVVFLADMMNDLSTLSRAERGKLQVQPENIDIHELIEGLQRDYRSSAEAKGLKLLIHVSKEVQTLFSSKLYVREVLQNFLTNSIKYTQTGEVKLSATMDGEVFKFAVQDTGIGMSLSDQKMLFKKFFRSEDYRTRENNGTGLGLYVTMKLAKLIGASIDVKSELNSGSTFTISITSISKEELEA